MSEISSRIDCSTRCTLRVRGINIDTFENVLIAEFRLMHRLSSFNLYFLPDDVDGGMIFATSADVLSQLREFLSKRKGFYLRDDIDGRS